ncbi:hypothetical protein BDZ91DRAFT_789355 [Kalaharituber pfeilii]|nr:hypothetical protein BDZ91DRAFT_789355 [Kalaharituber pfeilii]
MFFAQMLFTRAIRMVTFLPFLIILFSSGIAAEATIWSRKEPANPTNSIVQTTCGFDGNADMYGLGVRIGVYLQTFACIWAKYFRLDRALESLAFSSGLLRLALLISLSYVTIKEERLEAVDTAIMVFLALISNPPFDSLEGVSFPSKLRFRTLGRFFTQMAPLFRWLIGLGLISYSVWFWWTGLETLEHSPCTGTTFFFAKVSLYNWFRWLGRIYTIYTLIVLALITLKWFRWNWFPNSGSAGNSSRNSESKVEPPVWGVIDKIPGTAKAVSTIVVNGLIILAIELTISDVYLGKVRKWLESGNDRLGKTVGIRWLRRKTALLEEGKMTSSVVVYLEAATGVDRVRLGGKWLRTTQYEPDRRRK